MPIKIHVILIKIQSYNEGFHQVLDLQCSDQEIYKRQSIFLLLTMYSTTLSLPTHIHQTQNMN